MCVSVTQTKTIQIIFDEALLAELDATEEARQKGRSAVLRKAVREYQQRRRRHVVAEGYRRAYGDAPDMGIVARSGSTSSNLRRSAGRSSFFRDRT